MNKTNKTFYTLLLIIVVFFTGSTIPVVANIKPSSKDRLIATFATAILIKSHYKPSISKQQVDISEELFNSYIKKLDPNKTFFIQSDINTLKKFANKDLFSELAKGEIDFPYQAFNLLIKRVEQRNEFFKAHINDKFDFSINEDFYFNRDDLPYCSSIQNLKSVWLKQLKNDLLSDKLLRKIDKTPSDKKSDLKKRILYNSKSFVGYLKKRKSIDILELYLNAFMHIFDPHSDYMSPTTEDQFNIKMGLSFVGIGVYLSDDFGYTKVEKLIPGGPADKSGELHPGDKIIAVGDNKDAMLSVVNIPVTEVVKRIRGSKNSYVYMSIIKSNQDVSSIPTTIKIKRNKVNIKDSEVTGKIDKIKKGDKEYKIGIIEVPSFYLDLTKVGTKANNIKSSKDDIEKVLKDFIKKKVDGIILDLRNNGGGSLRDGINATGLFSDKKEVVQTKDSNHRLSIVTQKSKYIYNGPLIVLTNKFTASAAEICAAALQDYGRAIVIGDRSTHGKGTVQTVIDLTKLAKKTNLSGLELGMIKLTNAMFYRVDGSSTQQRGITPDITFNSITDSLDLGEAELKHSLPWDYVNPIKEFKKTNKLKPLIEKLEIDSVERRKKDKSFKELDLLIDNYNKIKEQKTVSLNEKLRFEKYLKEKKILEEQKKALDLATTTKPNDKIVSDIILNETENIMVDYINLLKPKS